MQTEQAVLVKCLLSRGGFPSERVFYISAPEEGWYTGIAPATYCYAKDRNRQAEPARGEKVEGYVVGIALGESAPGQPVRVYLPDGNVYDIDEALIERK